MRTKGKEKDRERERENREGRKENPRRGELRSREGGEGGGENRLFKLYDQRGRPARQVLLLERANIRNSMATQYLHGRSIRQSLEFIKKVWRDFVQLRSAIDANRARARGDYKLIISFNCAVKWTSE